MPHQHLLFSVHICFLIVAILMDVNWHCTVFLISISLMFIDAEHLCMCLLAVCVSCLEKYLFKFFIHFFKLGCLVS